ncbi:M1 family metallopeptidase [Mucilaginibacter sp.]|uniref:M1 family metallopeptidase n=1 Tax=Mucilaginibacter sp. TaxID=1882438 RepID=UPI000CA900D8|nr:M1 family metallopeptidase [Mucilaginibacter sp.]PLW88661.1 MAG: aminopeptidase [Mucilaginibacter sp.]HEK21426.1 M1 family peptidase [Bacteroidota bacterium]
MFKKLIIVAVLSATLSQLQAQTLYMPRDIKRAYANGTRSMDGKPGQKYWQNHSRYDISITTAPPESLVKGVETITYYNNSPDTLKRLNMKLILNVHRPGAARMGATSPDYLTKGVQIDDFKIAGQARQWNNATMGSTNQMVPLPKPLMPHDSVQLNISWHFDVSKQSGREGMIDSTSFYLAYFYPRVSVYDDYNGWDRIEFIDAQEFYNDFNDYTLNVTVPKNYVVWATGTLQNAPKVLQKETNDRLQKSFTSDSTIHVATADEMAAGKVTAQNATNTWTWTASNISDVAVGVSNHYIWDAGSVVVDKNTGRRASMQAAYSVQGTDFKQSVQFGRNALSWFSTNWPGVPYPFPKMTAFQGFADMEYPMMVNDSQMGDPGFAQLVQDHEIAHTWFPFYMGINETRYAFMDEGWATTLEYLIGTAEKGKEKADAFYKQFRINGWINNRSSNQDIPTITQTSELTTGYGNNAYGKPSLSYLALKDMLGDELFKKALHGYMDRWHGKHPIPWDYFNSMSNVSGKNLTWFFNNWFFTNGYDDLAIKNVVTGKDGYTLTIANIGGFAIPFDVVAEYTDGTKKTIHQTPSIWEKNQKEALVTFVNVRGKSLKSITLDNGIFMDATPGDNTWLAKK